MAGSYDGTMDEIVLEELNRTGQWTWACVPVLTVQLPPSPQRMNDCPASLEQAFFPPSHFSHQSCLRRYQGCQAVRHVKKSDLASSSKYSANVYFSHQDGGEHTHDLTPPIKPRL